MLAVAPDVRVPITAKQLSDELDRWSLATPQPDDRAHALLGSEPRHCPRLVEVAPERPLAVDGLPGGQCGADELSMARDLHRHRDDVRLAHQLLVVPEHHADPEHLAGGTRRFPAAPAR